MSSTELYSSSLYLSLTTNSTTFCLSLYVCNHTWCCARVRERGRARKRERVSVSFCFIFYLSQPKDNFLHTSFRIGSMVYSSVCRWSFHKIEELKQNSLLVSLFDSRFLAPRHSFLNSPAHTYTLETTLMLHRDTVRLSMCMRVCVINENSFDTQTRKNTIDVSQESKQRTSEPGSR